MVQEVHVHVVAAHADRAIRARDLPQRRIPYGGIVVPSGVPA